MTATRQRPGPTAATSLWVDVGIAAAAASCLFAFPLYVHLYATPDITPVLRLAGIFQLVPAVSILAGLRSVGTRGPRAHGIAIYVLALASTLSILRMIEARIVSDLTDIPWALKNAAVVVALVVVTALAARWARAFRRDFAVMGAVSTALTLLLLGQLTVSALAMRPAVVSSPAGGTVVLIIFDELGRDVLISDGRVDAVRFPNIAALAEAGVLVPDSTTNYGDTCRAIPAMLTGRFVAKDACQSIPDPGTPDLLDALSTRYSVRAYGEYLRTCDSLAVSICRGIPYWITKKPELELATHFIPVSLRKGAFGDYLFSLSGTGIYTPDIWQAFMDDLDPAIARGSAFFVHLLLPHPPFIYDGNGELSHSPSRYFLGGAQDDAAYAAYQQQVLYVDRLVGQLVDRMRSAGLYDQATIAIVGDHGPRGGPILTSSPEELVGVSAETPHPALIVKSPLIRSLPRPGPYQSVDFAPTIGALLGLPPLTGQGRNIFGSLEAPERRFIWRDHQYRLDDSGRWLLAN